MRIGQTHSITSEYIPVFFFMDFILLIHPATHLEFYYATNVWFQLLPSLFLIFPVFFQFLSLISFTINYFNIFGRNQEISHNSRDEGTWPWPNILSNFVYSISWLSCVRAFIFSGSSVSKQLCPL